MRALAPIPFFGQGGYAHTACNFLCRLVLFRPIPFPSIEFINGLSGGFSSRLRLIRNPYIRGGFFFPLVDSEFWNSFPSIGFSDELSGELNPLAEPNRNPYIRGGIRLQIDKVEILPLDPKYINPTPPEEGFEMA